MDTWKYEAEMMRLRTDLTQRLGRVARHIHRRDAPVSAALDEQAIERQNDEVVFALDDTLSLELRAVEAALARVQNGTFGCCVTCGDEIESARLDALPLLITVSPASNLQRLTAPNGHARIVAPLGTLVSQQQSVQSEIMTAIANVSCSLASSVSPPKAVWGRRIVQVRRQWRSTRYQSVLQTVDLARRDLASEFRLNAYRRAPLQLLSTNGFLLCSRCTAM
ncbi:MAG: RNA polymerase-binding transcription factor DksA [Gammaproteobacteria bacterium]|jgi:RNA polymerase-binding transcription factor DksA